MSPSDRASESHDHELMELVVDPTNPFTTTGQLRETKEGGGDMRKLLATDSSISIPPYPYDSTLSESALPSPTTPSQVQVHIPETTLRTSEDDMADRNSNHPVLKVIEKEEFGKALLALTPTMAMGLLTIHHSLAGHPIEMELLAVSLCLAFLLIWNGVISKMTHPKASTLLLLAGFVFVILAFYLCLCWILPTYLKSIPVASFFLSIFQLVPVFLDVIRCMKKKGNKMASKETDLEKAVV